MPGHLSLSGHSGSQGQMTGPELGWSLVDNPLDSFNQSYQVSIAKITENIKQRPPPRLSCLGDRQSKKA